MVRTFHLHGKDPGSIPGASSASSAYNVAVAQWIARRTSNPEVAGSSPASDTIFA